MTTLAIYSPATAGGGMLLLAGWLMWLSPERRAARAFAVLLTMRGLSLIALTLTPAGPTLEAARAALLLYPVLCLAAVVAVLYFVAVYPAPRSWLPTGLLGPTVFFVPLAAVVVLAVLEPGLVSTPARLSDVSIAAAFDVVMGTARRPIGVAPTLLDFVMLVPALALVREYLDSAPGRKRSTLLLVSFGFFAPAACSCLMAGALLQLRDDIPRPATLSIYNYVEMGIFGAWFLVLTGLLLYLATRAVRESDPAQRGTAALFALVVIVSALAGGATALFRDPLDTGAAIFAMVAFWSVLGALVVTYGIVRHSLFDIDFRVKRTLERGTVAAAFVAVYFVVSESAAELFGDFSGSPYLGIGAAALLLMVIQPLERFAAGLASRAMPAVRPLRDLDREERIEFYREHLELLWMDGQLTAKDRLVLASLRTRLDLEAEAAEGIELEVLSAGVAQARPRFAARGARDPDRRPQG